ncbi:MAG: amidohydrolase family protein [Acidobacteria bacterium]|nr:amidohydrolase family protein [Acidobacteriota bacterium]
MKKLSIILLAVFLVTINLLPIYASGKNEPILIKNATIYPITSEKITGSDLLIENGKIINIGKDLKADGARIIDATGLNLYPGLIDGFSKLGMVEMWAIAATTDTTEVGRMNPELKTTWALNPFSVHIRTGRITGITTAIVGSSGSLFPGIASLIKLDGWTTDEMTVNDEFASILIFPVTPRDKKPELNDKKVQEIKDIFKEVKRYAELKKLAAAGKSDFIKTYPKYDALIPVVEGKRPLIIEVSTARDIEKAIAFAEEMKPMKVILYDCVQGYRVADKIAKSGLPVMLADMFGGFMSVQPYEPDEAYDAQWTNPAALAKAGVKFCFTSGGVASAAKDMPYFAARAVAFGLDHDTALKAMTINTAEILGIADRVGSIEIGKDADIILVEGDPLDVRSVVKYMFIDGREIDLKDNVWDQFYDKWNTRPKN